MPRGLDGHSPANVTHYLKGIDFPASKEDLLEQAMQNDAEHAVCEIIGKMPDEHYQTMADVMRAYGEAGQDDSEDMGGKSMGGKAHRQY